MSELLIEGPKESKLDIVEVHLLNDKKNPSYPMDAAARYVYFSKMGGFITPEQFISTPLDNPAHYGAGGFEGVRVYYTPYGTAFPELENNIVRIMLSTIAFNDIIQDVALTERRKEDFKEAKVVQPTARQLFENACKAYHEMQATYYKDVPFQYATMEVTKLNGDKNLIPLNLQLCAKIGDEMHQFSMREVDTIMKVLAYTSGLVSIDHFPNALEMTMAGYFRPFFWVSGEGLIETDKNGEKIAKGGLKVPTGGKVVYFAATTLPWGKYLEAEYYETGIDVLYAPYPRIGCDMPTDKKVAGNYVNSALNINLAKKMGFGEILAFKGDKIVEGSAENIYVVMPAANGKHVVFVPPVSDGPLPGTTRDRVIRVLEHMEHKGNVEIVYESPTKEQVEKACAVLLSGTGAQLIHVREITEDDNLAELIKVSKLGSEEQTPAQKIVTIRKESMCQRKILINNGKKHDIIDEIQRGYERLVLTPSVLRPVYNIDIDAFAKTLGMEATDFAPKAVVNDYRAGMLRDYKNCIYDTQRMLRTTANVIQAGFEKKGLLLRKTA